MIKVTTIEQLLEKPVCMMTGQELTILLDRTGKADAKVSSPPEPEKHYEYGIEGLAKVFGCSIPTANRIKKSGVIDAAIVSVSAWTWLIHKESRVRCPAILLSSGPEVDSDMLRVGLH